MPNDIKKKADSFQQKVENYPLQILVCLIFDSD